MLTLKRINKEIAARGWQVELVRGKDYFYLDGEDMSWAYSSTIAVYRLKHMTLERWMRRIEDIVMESRSKAPY